MPGVFREAPPSRGAARRRPGWGAGALLTNRGLLCFSACMVLFFLANAAMLPLVGSVLTLRASETATAPRRRLHHGPAGGPGRQRPRGRPGGRALRPLPGAAVRLRRAAGAGPAARLYRQPLRPGRHPGARRDLGLGPRRDGAARRRRTSPAAPGASTSPSGAVGTAMGIGAALSTSLAGIMADRLGSHSAFLGLAFVGFAAFMLVALIMPETRQADGRRGADRPRHRIRLHVSAPLKRRSACAVKAHRRVQHG